MQVSDDGGSGAMITKRPRAPRAVCFDLDGTLYVERSYALARLELGARLYAEGSGLDFDTARETLRQGLRTREVPSIGWLLLRSGISRRRWRDAILDECPPAAFLTPAPRVHDALARLRPTCDLAIISNSLPEIIDATLDALGIGRELFTVVSGIDGRESLKPEPYLFQRALTSMKLAPGEAVMVGDSPFFDLEPAARLGMHTRRAESPEAVCAWLGELSGVRDG